MISDSAPRLDGWKAIAEYLECDISTAQRWERERALPVRRVPGGRGKSVFALVSELNRWRYAGLSLGEVRRNPNDVEVGKDNPVLKRSPRMIAGIVSSILVFALGGFAYLQHGWRIAKVHPDGEETGVSKAPQIHFDYSSLDAATPEFVTVADLDGDGVPDIVASSPPAGLVTILLGQGQRRFRSGLVFRTCRGSMAPIAADLDHDGKVDLVLPCWLDNGVVVLWGDGHGGFSVPQRIALEHGVRSIAVGDLDGNGFPDIVAASPAGGIYTILNAGSRHLKVVHHLEEAVGAADLVLSDLDHDGTLDLVASLAAEGAGDTVLIAKGSRNGQFSVKQKLAGFQGPYNLRVVNADASGHLRIALLDLSGGLYVLREVSPFRFDASLVMRTGTVSVLEVGDLHGEGRRDLLISLRTEHKLQILTALPDMGFSKPDEMDTTGYLGCAAIADVDGDGLPDIIAPLPNSSQLWIAFNSSASRHNSQ